ncbi:MAG: PAS domain S-box protein [Woeseiaceae bacterium]
MKLLIIILFNLLFLSVSVADDKVPVSLLESNNIFFAFFTFLFFIFLVFFVRLHWRDSKQNKNIEKDTADYKALLESTAAIPWELDLNTWLFTYIGPQIEIISGYKPEEWYVENFWEEHLHPADKESSVLFCTKATARNEDHEFEYRFIKKDGTLIWMRDSVQVITKDGVPVVLRGFIFDITKQKEESELQNLTELHLTDAQSIAHIGSWDIDLVNDKLTWSAETYRIFELDPNKVELTYENYIEVIHPDDRQLLTQAFNDSIREHTDGFDSEHRLLMEDGRIKFVSGRGRNIYNENGDAIRSFGSVQDITDRKRTEEAINTIASTVSSNVGDEFFKHLVKNMAEVFDADYAYIGLLDGQNPMQVNTYMVYAHGKIASNISYLLSGTPCVNIVGKEACAYPAHVQQLFPDDKLLNDMGVESYIGLPLYTDTTTAIGLVVVMDSKPMKNTPQMEEVLKIFAARTEAEFEKKKANETIQQLSLAVEQSPNLIIITNARGKIEYVNSAFVATTGYSVEDVLNKTPSVSKSGEMRDDLYDDLWKTIISGKTWSGELYNKKSNGELYWVEAKISPIKNVQGEITHYLSQQSDITDKKIMEQQLRRSQKMDALGKLTGGIAHDYNNMLNVIMGYSELMSMVVTDKEVIGFIKEIQHATDRASALTTKLLAFSRKESSEPEEVIVNELLLDTKNMLEKTLTVRIKLDYQLEELVWPIYVDKGDLEDAILNMCINSMHAMSDGGELILSTSNRTLIEDEALVLNLPAGEYVQLSLADNGCGIKEEVLNQIFDPFFTTKGDMGTGLGLTQVYGFVKRARGTITIDSSINSGTYTLIYFPRHFPVVEEKITISDNNLNLEGTETILVVDDEVAICELSSRMLGSKGYNVLVAHSGAEALSILDNNKIDLIVSDVIMPNMDGYKLAEKVREKFPKIKIQLVSGFEDDRVRTEDDELLSDDLLHKPYNSNDLFIAVRKLLNT